jgi:hypothetical protein
MFSWRFPPSGDNRRRNQSHYLVENKIGWPGYFVATRKINIRQSYKSFQKKRANARMRHERVAIQHADDGNPLEFTSQWWLAMTIKKEGELI